MNGMLRGAMIGHMLGSDGGRAERNAAVAEAELAAERKITKHRVDAADWRSRAAVLATNLNARKMSEDALLQALQKENANHPLASREAVDALRHEAYEKEKEKKNTNYDAYTANIEKLIP
jgi:hypothetical protein